MFKTASELQLEVGVVPLCRQTGKITQMCYFHVLYVEWTTVPCARQTSTQNCIPSLKICLEKNQVSKLF
jgi:hypothetical protein